MGGEWREDGNREQGGQAIDVEGQKLKEAEPSEFPRFSDYHRGLMGMDATDGGRVTQMTRGVRRRKEGLAKMGGPDGVGGK